MRAFKGSRLLPSLAAVGRGVWDAWREAVLLRIETPSFSEGLPSLSTCSVGWRVANISLCFGCWSLIFKALSEGLPSLSASSFGWPEAMRNSLAKLLLLLLLIFRGCFLVLARKRSFFVGFSQLLLHVRRNGEIGSNVFQQAGAAHNLPFISG